MRSIARSQIGGAVVQLADLGLEDLRLVRRDRLPREALDEQHALVLVVDVERRADDGEAQVAVVEAWRSFFWS